MSKIIINKTKCQGYGTCVAICPEIFKIDKDGKSTVIKQDLKNPNLQRAIDSCPTQAISIKE